MKSAIATRFRCSSPLTDLEQLAPMFLTLILQYLNKLVERKIGDFSSPKPFHTRKVQSFNGDCIKLLTKFSCELPMKVFALIANPPIEASKLPNTPPPAVRTSNLSAKAFVERPKFVQGAFQWLSVLFLLTCAKCQICVFHTKVCPDTLTRRWQKFRFYKVRDYVEPIITASITFYCDTTDIAIKLTVFMESIRSFIISPFTSVPFPEREGDTIVFQRPARLFEREGFKLMSFFDFRSTAKFLEKSVIRQVNAFEFLLDCLAWQRLPMWVCRSFQIRHVRTHCSIIRIRQPAFIALTLPLMEILMDLPHIVKQVSQSYCIRLIAKLILIGSHGLSGIRCLSAKQSEASTLPSGNAVSACQPDTLIIPQFLHNVKSILEIYALSGKPISQT